MDTPFATLSLRKPLAKMIPGLSKLRWGKLEAEFNSNLVSADETAQSVAAGNQTQSHALLDILLEIVAKSPSAAILEAWRNVELEISKFASIVAPEQPKIPSWVIVAKLYEKTKVDSKFVSLITQLRIVRNETAHSRGRLEIGERQAVTFIHSSIRAIDYLKSVHA